MSDPAVRAAPPVLAGDFSLIPVVDRLSWRDALALYLLGQMRSPNGFPLPKWKSEEQVVPMNLAIAGLLEQGVTEPQAIEHWFSSDTGVRSEYASSK